MKVVPLSPAHSRDRSNEKAADITNRDFAGVEAAARNGFPTFSLLLSELTTVGIIGRGVDDQTLSYVVWNSLLLEKGWEAR